MRRRCFAYIPTVLLLLSGCSGDRYADTSDRPIVFNASDASLSADTRAYALKPDDPEVLLHTGRTVSLFGARIEGATRTVIFDNQTLSCTAAPSLVTPSNPLSSDWGYYPLKYWQNSGRYYFSAVYPNFTSGIYVDNDYFLHLSYRAGDNRDVMVARGYRDVTGPLGTDPVPLVFLHATSAVRFLIGKASSSASDEYKLTDFRLDGLALSGSLKVLSQSETNPSIVPANWTPGVSGSLVNWVAHTDGDRISVVHPDDTDDPEDYTQMGWYYMVPQVLNSASSVRFSVSYNGQDPVTTVLSIENRDGEPGADSWIPNCVYNYYIILTQSGVNLKVEAVPWDGVQVTTEEVLFEG